MSFSVGFVVLAAPALAMGQSPSPERIAATEKQNPGRPISVEMKPFPEELVRNCKISYGRPVAVVAPMSGRLTIEARDGQQVTAGDILAQYDTTALERRAEEIGLDVEYLKAQLGYRTGPYQENTRAIQNLDEQDKSAARDHLAAQVAEMKRLYEQGRLALGRFQETQRALAVADSDLERARRQHDMDRRAAALDVIRLKTDKEKRENALEEAQERLASATVRAAASGRLVDVETSVASDGKVTVNEGERLALLVAPQVLGARVQFNGAAMRLVREADISVIPEGDSAPLEAEISAVRSVEKPADRQRGDYVTEVEIAFRDQRGPALLNRDATCRFSKPSVEEAPAVPVSAVMIQNDHSYVQKLGKRPMPG